MRFFKSEKKSIKLSSRKRGVKMRKTLRNNRRVVKSAVDGGWEVKTDEAWEAYDFACEYMGKEAIDDAIVRAMGDEQLAECLAYVFRMHDFREWDERFDDDDYLSNSRSQIVSMTQQDAKREFKNNYGTFNDYWEMQEAWTQYVDDLVADGVISETQANKWGNPCTPETFKRWNK